MFKNSVIHLLILSIALMYLIVGTWMWVKIIIGIALICFLIVCVRQFLRDIKEIWQTEYWDE